MSPDSQESLQPGSRSLPRIAILVIFAVVIVAFGAAGHTRLAHAYHLATSHSPETYTELSFEHVTKLPTQVTAGRLYKYTVHLANHEAVIQTYRLVATVAVPGVHDQVTVATVRLRSGDAADKTFSFSLPVVQKAAIVTVSLPAKGQSITFRTHS